MGNRTLFGLFISMVLLSTQAWADNWGASCSDPNYAKQNPTLCSTTQKSASSRTTQSVSSSTCDAKMAVGTKCECPFSISALSFVGEKFTGDTFCIKASNDNEARNTCTKLGYNYINPGNPDYLPAAQGLYGNQSSNQLNFYYCNKGVKKKDMCEAAKAKYPALKFNWSTVGNSVHKDGICQCDKNGDKSLEDCSQPDVPKQVAEECKEAHQVASKDGKGCDCEEGYELKNSRCVQKQASTPVPAGVSPEMAACVKPYAEQAKLCVSSSADAKTTCDQADKSNKGVSDALDIPGEANALFARSKAGSGMLTECMLAGAIASGSQMALSTLEPECESNYKTCEENCGEDKYEKYKAACGALAIKNLTSEEQAALNNNQPNLIQNADYKYYNSQADEIKKNQDEGTPVCKTDAAKNKSDLSAVLSSLGNSLATAQQCACQVTSTVFGTSTSTCTSLPTAAQCRVNPSLAGCPAVVAIDICTQGSANYSAQGCACQTNPKGEGCPQYVAAVGGLSGFAGADVGTGSSNGNVNFGAPGTNGSPLGSGDLNLNGTRQSELSSGDKSVGLGGGGGGNLGGGAGGLAATPSGGDNPNAAVAGDGDGDKGLLGGAFGMAKSIAGSLFGGGNKSSTAGAGSKAGVNPNLNKFRPNNNLRGLANSSEYGGKNAEIWTMMHDVYGDSHPTFLYSP